MTNESQFNTTATKCDIHRDNSCHSLEKPTLDSNAVDVRKQNYSGVIKYHLKGKIHPIRGHEGPEGE